MKCRYSKFYYFFEKNFFKGNFFKNCVDYNDLWKITKSKPLLNKQTISTE